MTIFAADIPNNRKPMPAGGVAGSVVVQKALYAFPVGAAVGDIIDLAVLPARNTIVAARLVLTGSAVGCVSDICLLSGQPGDTKSPRILEENVVQPPGATSSTKYTVSAVTVADGGQNYQSGQKCSFSGGSVTISDVGNDGAVTAVEIADAHAVDTDPAGNGVGTTGGSGTGLTLNVTTTKTTEPVPPANGDGLATDAALILPPEDDDRSIGVSIGTVVPANSGTITLVLEYAA